MADSSTPATASASAGDNDQRAQHTFALDGSRANTMGLFDLSGALNPDTPDTMRDHFRRFRAARQKTIEGADLEALRRSWCAFIRRWNRMSEAGESFVGWLAYREEILADHSLAQLRGRVCQNACNEDRLCFVNVKEGCESCGMTGRPTNEDWLQELAERPFSGEESAWISKYKRTRSQMDQAVNRGGSRRRRSRREGMSLSRRRPSPPRWRSRSRSRSPRARSPSTSRHRTREPRQEHRGGNWREAPMYPAPAGTPAIEPDTRAWRVPHNWYSPGLGARQSYPQFGVSRPPNQQSAEGLRGGTAYAQVAHHDVETAVNRALNAQLEAERPEDRACRPERTTAWLRQSNHELLSRLRALEMSVYGAAQHGARPREQASGADGSMARQARRAARPLYAPAADSDLESRLDDSA
ncbi:hypothetical protein PI124_g18776 [Phytophthora idaei]|nr:hypothetical protein PI124_g18776 [Phytophthora idaei]